MSVVVVVCCQVEVSATGCSLPTVVRRCGRPRNLLNGEAIVRVGPQRHREKIMLTKS